MPNLLLTHEPDQIAVVGVDPFDLEVFRRESIQTVVESARRQGSDTQIQIYSAKGSRYSQVELDILLHQSQLERCVVEVKTFDAVVGLEVFIPRRRYFT